MSKKDYVLIAEVFRGEVEVCDIASIRLYTCQAIAKSLSDALSRENPRFDSGRFLTACGIQ